MTVNQLQAGVRKLTLLFATLIVMLSGIAMIPTVPASAASDTCASRGYTLKGTHPILMKKSGGYLLRTGTLEIYYSGSIGKHCAMAKCNPDGWCFNMFRTVKLRDGASSTWQTWDSGMYTSYAGPIVIGGRCIDAYAAFSQSPTAANPTAYGGASFNDKYCR